jgi:hypothetical protein
MCMGEWKYSSIQLQWDKLDKLSFSLAWLRYPVPNGHVLELLWKPRSSILAEIISGHALRCGCDENVVFLYIQTHLQSVILLSQSINGKN